MSTKQASPGHDFAISWRPDSSILNRAGPDILMIGVLSEHDSLHILGRSFWSIPRAVRIKDIVVLINPLQTMHSPWAFLLLYPVSFVSLGIPWPLRYYGDFPLLARALPLNSQ